MQIIYENPIHLIADENMILTNGEVYSSQIWLGIYDSPSNWREVPIEEVPQDEFEPHNLLE